MKKKDQKKVLNQIDILFKSSKKIYEFCADIDSVWSSYYITKQRNDDKIHFGPAWDFDLSLDNDNNYIPQTVQIHGFLIMAFLQVLLDNSFLN